MTTAYLEVLNDYATDDDYIEFRDALGRWACQWVGEVAAPIARYARELFADASVRALVMRWDKLSEQGRAFKLRDFAMASEAEEHQPIERNVFEHEAGELSQALYYLLVQKWD